MFKNVGTQDGFFGKFKFKGDGEAPDFEPLGRAAYVKAQANAWDVGECSLDITFSSCGEEKTITIPRSHLTAKNLLEYSGQGLDAFDHTVLTLIKLFQKQENELPDDRIFYEHHGLGWAGYNGHTVFRGYKIKKKFLDSDYMGNFNIEPHGTMRAWSDMINRCVVGNTALEYALAVGFSSVLVYLLADKIDSETIFVHFFGASSTGKTTAACLAASVAGSPNIQDGGLVRTWNTTENAAIRSLVGNNGFPVVFDELSMQGKKDLSSFTYIVSSGIEKRRLNDKRDIGNPRSFQTTIISTGEASLINKTNGNTGLRMRLIEIGNIPFTPDSETAIEIKNVCAENYGLAISSFADYALLLGKDTLDKAWKICYDRLISDLPSVDRYVERLAKKQALILLAAKMIRKRFKFSLGLKKMIAFIANSMDSDFNERPVDITNMAYEKLVQFVEMHRSQFSDSYESTEKNKWGKFSKRNLPLDVAYQIFIPSDKFREIMVDFLNFEDFSVIKQGFKEKKFIECDKDRYTMKRKITSDGVPVRCYVVNVFDDLPDEKGEFPKKR